MSIFKEANDLLRRFLWKNNIHDKFFFTPLASSNTYQPEEARGLGFKKLQDFNQTMLAKVASDFVINPQKLWVKVFSSKYIKDQHFLSVKIKTSYSYIWKGLKWTKEKKMIKGNYWELADGLNINI